MRKKRVQSTRKGLCCITFFINYKLVFQSCCPSEVSLTHKQLNTVMTVGQLPKFINLKKFIVKMYKRNIDQTMEVQKRFGFSVWDTEDGKNQ